MDKSINVQRTQSLLMELIPEALSGMNDSRINGLTITEVNCKNGKYDADIYYDATDFNKQEEQQITALLTKVNGRIKTYCLSSTGWYKCPNFKFIADNTLEKSNNIEALFKQIRKES
ncbi:MAG: 30S ribosome-binding factor RbfA [Campylobacterota bacterium]|nr:30S ribosome-binding factor RbfA [Campylobacterota bacterium]